MSRLGKIARLPRTVRDTLNVRLQEGEHGPELLAWLNAEPAVQAVLAVHFGGHVINAQNLSDWRRGGYAAWCRQQDILGLAERLHEEKAEMDAMATEEELAGCFTQAAVVALLRELNATWGMEEGKDRLRAVLAIVRAMDRLRRRHATVERASRERSEEVRPVSQPSRPEAPPPAITPARRMPPPPALSPENPEGEEMAGIMAELMALAARLPDEPGLVAGRPGPNHPALQAA